VSPQWSLSLRLSQQKPVHTLPHTRYMSRPSHSSRVHHPHIILKIPQKNPQQSNLQANLFLPLSLIYLTQNKLKEINCHRTTHDTHRVCGPEFIIHGPYNSLGLKLN
jgi:hypothetical protein